MSRHRLRNRRVPLVVAAIGLLLASGGCDSGQQQQPRISGAPLPPDVVHRPYVHAVVRLTGGVSCSGTLITPRLVLTAAHCFGFDSADPRDRGLRGGNPACVVEDATGRIIARNGCGVVEFTHIDGAVTERATVAHAWVVQASSSHGRVHGRDLALAALDLRATPRTRAAAPSVPVWFERDPGAEHWKRAPIVYAGWGAINAVADTCEGILTAAAPATHLAVEWRKRLDGEFPVDSQSCCFPSQESLGTPMFVANFDLYGDSTGLTLKGDSGGPLLTPDGTGTMRVIGALSGGNCFDSEFSGTLQSLWARTFNDENAALIRRIVFAADGRARGSDNGFADPDGDGVPQDAPVDQNPFIDETDNCRDVANPDQADDDRDGIGNACARCPRGICTPPPAAPTGCHIPPARAPHCGFITIECDRPLPTGGQFGIGNALSSIGMTIWEVDSPNGRVSANYTNEGEASLVLCATNLGGQRCSNRFPATLGPTFCPAPPPPTGQPCPTGQSLCAAGRCVPFAHCNHVQ